VPAKLTEYNRKRDPKQTPEPFGSKKRTKKPIFVVQRHDARRLHYDFRLEMGGALASWAVPKGVPMEIGERHLAVHVEDHPLDYATFEGEIPKGNYGAGLVEIWDNGTYELLEEKRDGGLTVRLHGKRLDGVWTLVPAHLDRDPKNWLIIRKRGGPEDAAHAAGGREDYKPMLATLAKEVPHGDGWLYEVKWDGYRALAYVRGSEARLVSRNDNDLTGRFESVAKAIVKALKTPHCVLDGEICALDAEGRATFSAMQQSHGRRDVQFVFAAFDLLELEGETLTHLPLVERRKRLEQLLDRRQKTVLYSEAFTDGDALMAAAREQRFEGIMAKQEQSKYQEGKRSRDWLKVKATGRQEFVIVGYTAGEGRRKDTFGSLIMAVNEGGELRYVGNVGTGFDDAEIKRLLGKLRQLERKDTPLPSVPKMPRVRKADVHWVEPVLVAEVEFVEWTHDGRLRAPSYQGLRDDKTAAEVRREVPETPGSGKRDLKLSNLDKLYFPREGITKGDLIAYYHDVAPVLVPHLKNRPFTMIRWPDGIEGKHFFQKDAPSHMPDWIPTHRALVSTRESPPRKKWVDFAVVNDEDALLWMVNMGCIDMNTWYSRVDKPDRPDFVLFDLDPSPDVGFRETVQVALLVKQALDAFGLAGFPKTSSADGMHILVPIERRYTYDDTRQFAEIVAGAIARTHRGLATTEWTKSKRRGVLIDSNQNGEGKTISSAYSVRPRPGAPVSTPLRWDEVNEDLDARAFTMDVVLDRIRRHGDLFAGVLTTRQRLDRALAALGG
jgi:bifunctional non-homologous end joining protein LigD